MGQSRRRGEAVVVVSYAVASPRLGFGAIAGRRRGEAAVVVSYAVASPRLGFGAIADRRQCYHYTDSYE